jgi:hypothetical protein
MRRMWLAMTALAGVSAAVIVACAHPEPPPVRGPTSPPQGPVSVAEPDAAEQIAELDASVDDAASSVDAAPQIVVAPAVILAPASGPEMWLRGSTHVHAKPSGDSKTPIPDVIRWYETRGYDFIVLTDHNRVSEVGEASTLGDPAVRNSDKGLVVIAGIELTYNPTGCLPPGDESGRCRIHVNLLGVTGRVNGKLEWANRKSDDRIDKYQAAIDVQQKLGGIAQMNHPNWYWGMTADVLAEVARRGMPLVEIANQQFVKWNLGDNDHPSLEALWDAALAKGVTLWGVASDDAHDYDGGGKYPAGGAWVVVRAQRDAQSIIDALAAGRFYSSTGVTLDRVEVAAGDLVVEVSAKDPGSHEIVFVENGRVVATTKGKRARRALPQQGYVRATVTRSDGKQAWIQPARRQ